MPSSLTPRDSGGNADGDCPSTGSGAASVRGQESGDDQVVPHGMHWPGSWGIDLFNKSAWWVPGSSCHGGSDPGGEHGARQHRPQLAGWPCRR